MTVSRPMLSAMGALAALGIGLGSSAMAQWQNSPLMRSFADNWSSSAQNVVGQLASNDLFDLSANALRDTTERFKIRFGDG